jgi:hypothetical protein
MKKINQHVNLLLSWLFTVNVYLVSRWQQCADVRWIADISDLYCFLLALSRSIWEPPPHLNDLLSSSAPASVRDTISMHFSKTSKYLTHLVTVLKEVQLLKVYFMFKLSTAYYRRIKKELGGVISWVVDGRSVIQKQQQKSVTLVLKGTIPTERPSLVGEVSDKFSG